MAAAHQITYELKYFPMFGRAGPIRVAFKLGGVAFDDTHVQFPEWPALKPTIVHGGLPVLHIKRDGVVVDTLIQSNSILRFAGSLGGAGLYPHDLVQRAHVDEFLEAVESVVVEGLSDPALRNPEGDAARAAAIEHINNKALPAKLLVLENLIKGSAHVLGDQATVADLKLLSLIWVIKTKGGGVFYPFLLDSALDAFPKIVAVAKAAAALASSVGVEYPAL